MQDQATGNMIVVLIQTTGIKKTKQTERIKPRTSRGFLFINIPGPAYLERSGKLLLLSMVLFYVQLVFIVMNN
jgi:hypothetical protein